jgi:hypothetical protein
MLIARALQRPPLGLMWHDSDRADEFLHTAPADPAGRRLAEPRGRSPELSAADAPSKSSRIRFAQIGQQTLSVFGMGI